MQKDFDQHWQINSLETISNRKLQEAENFLRPILDSFLTKSVKVLDVGCGDGVHWCYLRNLDSEQLSYTGVDISAIAVQCLQEQNVAAIDYFLQMDATALAIPNDTYDIVFAFGVIAYTNAPYRCFTELCRVCKPGGWIGLWIYPKPEGLGSLAFSLTRQICQRVGPFWTRRIADLIVPFLGFLPTRSRVNLRNSSWDQCREIVLVNIAPKQLVFFHRDEIINWFITQAIDIEYEDRDNPITIWGRKQK